MKNTNTTKTTETKQSFAKAELAKLTPEQLVALHNADTTTAANKLRVIDALGDVLKTENTKVRNDFAARAARGTITDFARNQFIEITRKKVTDGVLSIYKADVRVSVKAVDTEVRKLKDGRKTLCADPEVYTYIGYFADNIARYFQLEMSDESKPAHVSMLRYGNDRSRKADFNQFVNSALYKQLDAIFCMVLGNDTKVHPTGANLKFILSTVAQAKANADAVAKLKSDAGVLTLIFNMIGARINEKAIVIETGVTKTKTAEQSKTTKQAGKTKQTAGEIRAEEAISKTAEKPVNALSGDMKEAPADNKSAHETVKTARKVTPKTTKTTKQTGKTAA